MKNRAQLATFASVPFVLLALLACKGKSPPPPTVSVTAATTAATAEPTADPTTEATATGTALATGVAPRPKPGTTPTASAAGSAKATPSASSSALRLALAASVAPTVARDGGAAGTAIATGAVFKVGDKVQVFWKNTWYPAAVVAVPSPGQYKIHYDGYEASWDEVVGNARIKAR